MNEIDELIQRAKSLSQIGKKQPKNRAGNDIFIYQDRPVNWTDWSSERDVTYISIYLPSQLPRISIPCKSIVLHGHTVFDPCNRNRFCHVYGWHVPDIYLSGFNSVWGYLYNPQPTNTNELRIDLSL